VTDPNGAAVPGLTAADFTITEGGTERPSQKVAPATARMHLMVMVEERLANAPVRVGIFEFAQRLRPFAETAHIAIGHRTTTLVDYTTDLDALAAGLNRLSLVPQAQSNFTEALLDVAQRIEQQRPERPVIVVVSRAGNRDGGASAKDVLDHLRQSGAMLYAVAIVDAPRTSEPLPTVSGTDDRLLAEPSRREDVLEGGTKQSGGRAREVKATAGVPKALQQIAAELGNQYVIQYTLPDGVKPDRRLSVRLKRTDLSLPAPTLLPDR
jgi:VWFA-related protein